jgi:hypothetical protein
MDHFDIAYQRCLIKRDCEAQWQGVTQTVGNACVTCEVVMCVIKVLNCSVLNTKLIDARLQMLQPYALSTGPTFGPVSTIPSWQARPDHVCT